TGTTGASHIAALVAGLLAAGLVAMLRLHAVGAGPIDVVPFVDMFREAETSAERWLVAGDGQAHGLVAADPTISSPDLYGQDGAAYAYRAQRPLLGTLAFVLSGGIEDRVAPALVALFVLSGALLCWALRQHVPLRWAIALSAAVVVMCSQS